ncbi:f-box only protein [Anaeramoeba flamelloides]|uniref:F-box only protein n=1 Tax=Anaeramoeba flamelloides TaxID=1746091 RepID=A0AAV8A3V6_9EUKA|nr:f-box only protein [Anaeramoeba flamelloides]
MIKPSSFISFDHLKFKPLLNFHQQDHKQTEIIETSDNIDDFELNNFELLPDEIIFQIFSYFEKPVHLGHCSCVNKRFNRVADDWLLWKQVLKENCDLLDFEEIQVNYFKPTQLVGRMGLVEYFSEDNYELPLKHQQPQQMQAQSKQHNHNHNNNNNNHHHHHHHYSHHQQREEQFQQSSKIENLARKIRKNPKKIFVEQIEKVVNAETETYLQRDYLKKKEKIEKIHEILYSPISIFFIFILIFPLTMTLLCLKLENIMFTAIPWTVLLIPLFLALITLIFSMAIPIVCSLTNEIFQKAMVSCLSLFYFFILSLSLRADKILFTTLTFPATFLFLIVCVSIYSSRKYYKKKFGYLNNDNTPKQYIIMQGSQYFYSNLYLSVSFISFLLLVLKIDYNIPISWVLIFSPLFLGEFVSLIGLFISFVSLFVCLPMFGQSVLVCLVAFFFGIPFTFTFFLTYLNVSNIKKLNWFVVSLPTLIPSYLITICFICIFFKKFKKRLISIF